MNWRELIPRSSGAVIALLMIAVLLVLNFSVIVFVEPLADQVFLLTLFGGVGLLPLLAGYFSIEVSNNRREMRRQNDHEHRIREKEREEMLR